MDLPKRPERFYLPDDLKITAWADIESFLIELDERKISSVQELKKWLKDVSEVEAVLEEDQAWRYIKMSINTSNQDLRDAYTFFVTEIQPKLAPFSHRFDEKLVNSPFKNELGKDFEIPLKKAQKNIEVFCEENIPLISKLQNKAQEFGAINGAMEVEVNGENVTMQKASSLLKDTNSAFRKEVFEKIASVRLENADKLDNLFDSLIADRHQLAVNAGYKNYRDYMFAAMQRFDYAPEDCFEFHKSVEEEIVPLIEQLAVIRKEKLEVESLKPYDLAVDPENLPPLKPFEGGKQLVEKTVNAFNRLDPFNLSLTGILTLL